MINLTIGKKYHKWTVISFDCIDKTGRGRWICECECKQRSSIQASAILANKTKSCIRCKEANLTGKKFGLWTVLSRSDVKSDATNSKTQWLCKCTCGVEVLVERCNLVRGKSKGCWTCRRNVFEANFFPKTWYRRLLTQAKQRKYKFEITEKELWDIWEKQKGMCALTGIPLVFTKTQKTTTASLDRINNKLDYVSTNVWFVHKHVNIMKFNYEIDYFLDLCYKIVNHQRAE